MAKIRKQLEPEIQTGDTKTVASMGGLKVSIYHLSEAGRPIRFRLAWQFNGVRQTRTHPFLAEAVEDAKNILRLRASGKDEVAQISTERLHYYQECEKLCPVPLETAVRFYLSHSPTAFTPTLIKDLVDNYVAELESRKGKRGASSEWVRTIRRRLGTFAEHTHKSIHEVTPEEIRAFVYNPKWEDRTQFNYQQALSILFRLAKDKKALPMGDTAYDQFTPKVQKPVEAEKEVLPPEHLRRMFKAAIDSGRKDFCPYLAIGAFGGVRCAEICRLRWGVHIDMDERVIRCTPDVTKTGRRRLVDMNDSLYEWLKLYQGKEGELVQPYCDFHRILEILWNDEAKLPTWPHNALRVSFVSYGVVHTGNAAHIANMAGHSEVMLQTVYKQIRGVNKKSAQEWFDISPASIMKGSTPSTHLTHPVDEVETYSGESIPSPTTPKPQTHQKYA